MTSAIIVTSNSAMLERIRAVLGDQFSYVCTQGLLLDLPPKQLGVNITEEFKLIEVLTPEGRAALRHIYQAGLKATYVFTDADEAGVRLAAQLRQNLSHNNVHHVILPHYTADAIKHFMEYRVNLPESILGAAIARRVLVRMKGVMLSQFLSQLRDLRKVKIPQAVSSETAMLLVHAFRHIRNRYPEEPHTLQIVCANGYVAREVQYQAGVEHHHLLPKTYPSETDAQVVFEQLRIEPPEVEAIKEMQHLRTIMPNPWLTYSTAVRLCFQKLGWRISQIEHALLQLIHTGYLSQSILDQPTLQFIRGRIAPYYDRIGAKNALSAKIWGGTQTLTAVFPILYTTEGMPASLMPVYQAILDYTLNTVRKPIEQTVNYLLLRMGDHYFLGQENRAVLKAPAFAKEALEVGPPLDLQQAFQLQYISALKHNPGVHVDDVFSFLNTREGSFRLTESLEQILFHQNLMRVEKDHLHLTAAGYLVGQYLSHFYGEVLSLTTTRYEEWSLQSIKMQQEEKLFVLHSWYQFFRRVHECAMDRLTKGEEPK